MAEGYRREAHCLLLSELSVRICEWCQQKYHMQTSKIELYTHSQLLDVHSRCQRICLFPITWALYWGRSKCCGRRARESFVVFTMPYTNLSACGHAPRGICVASGLNFYCTLFPQLVQTSHPATLPVQLFRFHMKAQESWVVMFLIVPCSIAELCG
jgi:hypothetical protein